MTKNKVIVIGLDAACWETIERIGYDKLPNINKLKKNGIKGTLMSTIPHWTAPAWTTLMTGVNPPTHGVIDFFSYGKSGDVVLTSNKDVKCKYLWEYLSNVGKKSIIINYPITHPVRIIDGIIIPGYLSTDPPPCYPPSVFQEIEEKCGNYRVYSPLELSENEDIEKRYYRYRDLINRRKDVALYLSKKYPWDLLVLQFQKTDAIFHDTSKINFFDFSWVEKLYIDVDKAIGNILETWGDKVNIVIVSDHGMIEKQATIFINKWLQNNDFASFTQGQGSIKWKKKIDMGLNEKETKFESNIVKKSDYRKRKSLLLPAIRMLIIKTKLDGIVKKLLPSYLKNSMSLSVDKDASIAYCESGSSSSIIINMDLITSRNLSKDSIIKELMKKLHEMRSNDGAELFENIVVQEIQRQNEEQEIRIFLECKDEFIIQPHFHSNWFRKKKSFGHKKAGLFIASGPDIVENPFLNKEIQAVDVVPTLLHLFGLTIPNDLEGDVIEEFFSVKGNMIDIKFNEQSIQSNAGYICDVVENVEEDEKILKRLEGLGYL